MTARFCLHAHIETPSLFQPGVRRNQLYATEAHKEGSTSPQRRELMAPCCQPAAYKAFAESRASTQNENGSEDMR